ncbi:MAG: hypothetical protein ACM4AI_08435 [Acidobacteriota bacterium]
MKKVRAGGEGQDQPGRVDVGRILLRPRADRLAPGGDLVIERLMSGRDGLRFPLQRVSLSVELGSRSAG